MFREYAFGLDDVLDRAKLVTTRRSGQIANSVGALEFECARAVDSLVSCGMDEFVAARTKERCEKSTSHGASRLETIGTRLSFDGVESMTLRRT